MKVGDYVRTKEFGINKVKWFDNEEPILENGFTALQSSGYKFSPNIIDLIEVGDILVIKDFVDEACMIFTDIYLIQNEQQLLNIKNDLEKNKNKKLYSIVTKEQFSCMEYKIGE